MSFCAAVLKACDSNTTGCRTEQIEIWESLILVVLRWGSVDLLVFRVIVGSFNTLVSNLIACNICANVQVSHVRAVVKQRAKVHGPLVCPFR